jgi:tetrapyrrole methylase family protein/MazG family protein
MKKFLVEFEKLVSIMAKLRSEKGCPWDKKQTYRSLAKYLLSEAEEVNQAVKKRDVENLKEELGDVLMQIVFYSQIAKERKDFDIASVIKGINQKLIRRHPHIFGNYKVKNAKDVMKMWQERKAKEKEDKRIDR